MEVRYNSVIQLFQRCLFFLILFTCTYLYMTYSVWQVYRLKTSGRQTEGIIDSVGMDEKNTVRIRYSYWVNGDRYEGEKYYKVINDNDPWVVDKVKEQIVSRSSYSVYYDPDDPLNVICFVTDEEIEFPCVAWKIILSAWGIVVVLYFVRKAVRRKKNT